MTKRVSPFLIVKEISDLYIRKNFDSLVKYFTEQNQLLDFKFFEIQFTEAGSKKITTGLGVIPQDIIVTKISGLGTISWDRKLSTANDITLSSTGPAIIRFYIGTYWNQGGIQSAGGEEVSEYKSSTASDAESSVPSGTILAFGGTTVPSGWLLCNGNEISRETYSNLFSVIGTAYGEGNAKSTFNIPDFRGVFLRGTDNGAGKDPEAGSRTPAKTGGNAGDAVGSSQDDAFQGHWHQFYNKTYDGLVNNSQPYHGYPDGGPNNSGSGPVREAVTDSVNGTPRVSSETRPKNVNVNYIIKT